MKRLPALGLLATLLVSSPSAHADDARLTVHAGTVETQIKSVDPERRRLYLPSLTFLLHANFACATPAAAAVTVSIADTHERFSPADGERSVTANIDVPRRQLAPVATGDFCIQGGPNKQRYLMLPGVATAQVSLRCASEAHATMSFASVPLAVRLECRPVDDQMPSEALPATR